jgi:ribonuclease P protein component
MSGVLIYNETMIPAPFRFQGHNSLRYVYANGKAVRSERVTIKWVKNTHRSKPRISVVVSKKVLKSAIGRNRIRRRVYEYMRLHTTKLKDVYDIVIIVTSPELRDIPAPELSGLLDQLFEKADLYKTS